MKKSVGTILVGLASLAFTVSASAAQYSGAGTWKSSKGTSGDYTAVTTVVVDNTTVNLTDVITAGGKTYTIVSSIHKTDDTFYDVYNGANTKIGTGYCIPVMGIPSKICHSEVVVNGVQAESTVKITEATIYRMGSEMTTAGEKIVWHDVLQYVPGK